MANSNIVLGLDIGDRHIGVAVGNTITRTATPLPDLPNNHSLVEQLLLLQNQYDFSKIIIGLPITATGQHGTQAHKVKELVEKLRIEMTTEIILEDERFTTQSASKYLREHPKNEASIDAISAQFILEGWLRKI
jgi:putative holliday junction resolvase